MKLDDATLVRIVEESATLQERIGPCFEPVPPEAGAETERARDRLQRWKAGTALGDDATFARRLDWDGLSSEQALAIANRVRLADGAPLPGWTGWLRAGLLRASELEGLERREIEARCRFFRADEPCAFEHVFAPFVLEAGARLKERAADLDDLIAPEAQSEMERHLLSWLCAVGAETLGLEFNAARSVVPRDAPFVAYWYGTGTGAGATPGTAKYDEFVRGLLAGGLVRVVSEFAYLGRLLGRLSELWLEATLEFVDRLRRDRPDLERSFGGGRALGRVAAAHAGLSDRHRGGRTTWRITFESGAKCIYKPKDLSTERAFLELLAWLNDRGAPLPLRVFEAVYREDHGWVEIVTAAPCPDEAAVSRYYQRAGHMLALAYALEANDFHHENVVAAGEDLVFIDLETILCHRVTPVEGDEPEGAASLANRVFFWDSVFRTALLPRWEFGTGGESYDVSGLGGVLEQATSFRRKAWKHINTDGMELSRETLHTSPSQNVVRIGERRISPLDHVEEMVGGFGEMYRLLWRRRDELFAPGGPLREMQRLRVRFLYRHTKIYSTLLNSYLLPQYLRDGFEASLRVDRLARPLLHGEERHPFWSLIAAESADLLQADIPLLEGRVDGDALELGADRRVPGFFAGPSFEALERRFAELSEDDLARQTQYIRSAFHSPDPGLASPSAEPAAGEVALGDDDLVAAAAALAEEARRTAIQGQDTATWIALQYHAEAQRWQLQPMAARMYDGISGTALFLAAAEAATSGAAGVRPLAMAAFRNVVGYLAPDWARLLFEPGVGAGLGATSLLYALVRGGQQLGEESLVEEAASGAAVVTPERIQADTRLDLLGGAAGAAVALLALHAERPRDEFLDKAVLCGRHLLAHRRAGEEDGPRAWPTLGGALLSGLSHGAAGIVLALERLHAATGDAAFLEAATEGREWENSIFDEAEGNWPDRRFPKGPRGWVFQASWCHGAPGIGLARLARPGGPDATGRRDVERAVQATLKAPPTGLDHVCCGELGRAEFLLDAGRRLGREDLEAEARRRVVQVVAQARARGRYALGFDSGPEVCSFHQGTAGVGWALLRLARPQLPSVLLWE